MNALFTIPEAAARLRITERKLEEMIARRLCTVVEFGPRTRLIREVDLIALIKRHTR